MFKIFITYIALLNLSFASSALSDEKKIDYLINRVKESGALFYRNGSVHTSEEAHDHLRFKLNYVKKRFIFFGPEKDVSVKEFIEKIASSSSSSGKPYYIKPKNGKKIEAKKWYYQQLSILENASKLESISNKNK